MGSSLWDLFADERIENLQECLLTVGVNGIFQEFENWLRCYGMLHPNIDQKIIDIQKQKEKIRTKST